MTYKKYESYKNSEIEWIGEMPENWDITKVKHELMFLDHKRVPLSAEVRSNIDKIYDYYGASGVIDKVDSYLFDGRYILVGEDGANLLSRSTPLAFIAEGKFWVNNHAHILSPINNDIDYFAFLLEATDYTPFIEGSAQPKLTADNLKNIRIIKPNIKEQKRIADFLDKRTSDIDENIAKNKELINLLEEKKTALINQVVTKGLNPNVPMKDSGIEWIGEIPEHWDVEKIKNVSEVKPSNVDKKSKDNEPPVSLCNYTDVYNNEFITNDLDFMKATASYDQIKKLSLNIGDVIITKDSESADDIAVPAIVVEDLDNVVCGYHLAVIRPEITKINPKFLFRSFESDKINKQFEIGANGVTRFGLGSYPINNSYICLPPLDEQEEIVNYLDKEISRSFKAIDKINKHIKLLEEYKTSLIHHVVTGKVDVRGEVL